MKVMQEICNVDLQVKSPRAVGSSAAALAVVFELVGSAREWRRSITGARPVVLVRRGAVFEIGVLVGCEEEVAA
ncbi:hypothetical protein ACWD6Q_31415 [Streptomyces nigra]|uniref:hypothetical protein n=1 Tax=Streptomyces nigra TaxID=1827580 RepID=UPI003451DC56